MYPPLSAHQQPAPRCTHPLPAHPPQYYGTCVGLAQLPKGTADQLRLSVGGRDGAFSGPICAWSGVTSSYFLFLAFLETRLKERAPLLSSVRRPPAGLLNPSGLGIGTQNVLLACLFLPVVVLRVVANLWWPPEATSLAPLAFTQWTTYEQVALRMSEYKDWHPTKY